MKKAAIGVDIGGGSVKLGLVDSEGRVLSREFFLTADAKGRSLMMKIMTDRIVHLIAAAKKKGLTLSGVGIGAPGPIDVERGFVYFFPNIPGWKNTPLKQLLEKRISLPVWVDNDASVMALAEFRFGSGRGSKNMIGLTLGTGVGGGIVIDGRLFHGSRFSAAEIGHLVLNEVGPICGCGSRGCVETYVGSGHFTREVRKRLDSGQKSVLSAWIAKGKELSPLLVAQAAAAGDIFSKKIWEETGEHLGTLLAGLANVLNPERIILGGGIAQNKGLLFKPAIRTLKKKAFPIAGRSVKVMPAALGVDAGLIGAAALALI